MSLGEGWHGENVWPWTRVMVYTSLWVSVRVNCWAGLLGLNLMLTRESEGTQMDDRLRVGAKWSQAMV